MSMEVTEEMIEAYRTEGAHIAIIDREKMKARLAAALEIAEREHRIALEARADAAYELGLTHGARRALLAALEELDK